MSKCSYSPINGQPCKRTGTIEVRNGGRLIKVCAEHVQRYTANGWKKV